MVNETGRSALTSLLAKMIVIFLHGRRGDENAIDFRLWLVGALIEQLVLGLLGVLRHQLTVVVLEWACARQIKLCKKKQFRNSISSHSKLQKQIVV